MNTHRFPSALSLCVLSFAVAAAATIFPSHVTAAAKHGAIAAHASAAAGPAAIGQKIFDKLLTRCGDQWFYAGSPFDGAGMLSNVQASHQGVVTYKGVQFHTVPITVSPAEHENGIDSRTRISMIAKLYREGDKPWGDGPGRRDRNMDDILGDVLRDAGGDMFDMGSGGSMAMELINFKGNWFIRRSGVDSTSIFSTGDKLFEVAQLLAAPMPRYSCSAGRVLRPGETE